MKCRRTGQEVAVSVKEREMFEDFLAIFKFHTHFIMRAGACKMCMKIETPSF